MTQEIEVPAKTDDKTGKVIIPATTTTQYVVNPDYNPMMKRIDKTHIKVLVK